MSNDFWENKIKAFLHDPPDKALSIANHENRRDKLLQMLNLKFDISPEFDRIASSMERVVPKTEALIDFSRTDKAQHPILKHPITGGERKFETISQAVLGLKKTRVNEIIEEILIAEVDILKSLKADDFKITYFRIWRFFMDLIAHKSEEIANLPADTRCPDHTIWNHLDASSAIYGAIDKGQPALLMFKLAPVQDFIKNARKERDLWASSHLLSYLTFQAMKVVIDEFGPDAIIFPHLRGQPFFDFDEDYGQYLSDLINQEHKKKLKIANIPNKFLAIVNVDKFNIIENKIREAVNKVLEDLLDFSLNNAFNGKINVHMKNHYLKLLQNYFSVTVCMIPADLNSLMNVIEKLPDRIKKKYENWMSLLEKSGYRRKAFDLYSLMFELIEEITAIESRKFVKFEGLKKEKCSLCGNLEIIGNKDTWKDVNRSIFKENERLCPVCLVKRMYSRWINEKWRIDIGFESVSEIALRKMLKGKDVTFYDVIKDMKVARDIGCESFVKTFYENVNKILNKLYLPINYELIYKENLASIKAISKTLGVDERRIVAISNAERFLKDARNAITEIERLIGEFPRYYAILMMDGDNMGRMLMGDEMKFVKDYLHPEVLKYLPQDVKNLIESTKRLITPATHSAISRALMHFSVNIVPEIVERYREELIYAGGDDVLALLPVDSALTCAYEIQTWFNKEWDGWNILPAKTMSAGILIVHYKHPLYDALDKVRDLEKRAKDFGRNAIAIGYLTRSGSYSEVVFNWEIVPKLRDFIELFENSEKGLKPSLSKRIIYHVVQEIENLPNDENAMAAFLKFEILRHYSGTDEKKEDFESLTGEVIKLAKNVRIKLENEDFEGLEDLDSLKLDNINSKINNLIRTGNISSEKLYNELKEILMGTSRDFYEKLYGLILKKQIRNFFILLKILVDCDADLGGASCENSDRT